MNHGDGPHGQWVIPLVSRYEGPLLLYAQRLVCDLTRARDVVQETFLKLCRARREDVHGHEAAWLYTVCRSTALDVKRKERRMSLLSEETAGSFASQELDPAVALEQTDSTAEVLRAVERLPEHQREAILLKFGHGLSYKEIAKVTGHSVSNVGFLIHAGLKAVRSRVAAEVI